MRGHTSFLVFISVDLLSWWIGFTMKVDRANKLCILINKCIFVKFSNISVKQELTPDSLSQLMHRQVTIYLDFWFFRADLYDDDAIQELLRYNPHTGYDSSGRLYILKIKYMLWHLKKICISQWTCLIVHKHMYQQQQAVIKWGQTIQWPKGQQWSTKHYTENYRFEQHEPN